MDLSSGISRRHDTIPAEFLKGKGMRQTRLVVVEMSIDGEVPFFLRDAIMVPLYKEKGAMSDMNNHRGLTLLSIGKLFERVLCGCLTVYFDSIAGTNPLRSVINI